MNLVAWHTARKMSERAALPDLDTLNHEALKALIVAQHAQILSKDEQLTSRDEEIERLKLLIAKLRRRQFGRSSEKLDRQIEQLELRLEALQQNDCGESRCSTRTNRERRAAGPTGTTTVASTSTARSADLSAKARSLPGLRWRAEASRRRRI